MDHPTRRLDGDEDAPELEPGATRRLDRPVRPPTQPASYPCRNCGDATIWTNVRSMYLEEINGSLLFRPHNTQLSALMCTECGYTELYAYKPKKLLKR